MKMANNMDKKEFWEALTRPYFELQSCDTCLYENVAGKVCIPCSRVGATNHGHPDNGWVWDGKTYECKDEY